MAFQESFFFADENRSTVPELFPKESFFALAQKNLFVGTSSWRFRGWEGLFYHQAYRSEAEFQRECLREYAEYFSIVGVDSTYYDWPQAHQMAALANATPENFLFCLKVTDKIVTESFPNFPRYGRFAGQINPNFMNLEAYRQYYWSALKDLAPRIGMVIFEFPYLQRRHFPLLRKFFAQAPQEAPYGIELRSPDLFGPDFYQFLEEINVSAVLNSWTKMPPLRQQFSIWKSATGKSERARRRPLVIRAILQPGQAYEEAVKLFEPYQELRRPYPDFAPTIHSIAAHAQQEQQRVFLLVSNCLEGSAPLTLAKLIESDFSNTLLSRL